MAKAAWFPSITLTGTAGHGSPEISDLFKWSARAWGVGALLALPIFDGGRREAGIDNARAEMDAALARYREQVLGAFRDVEDQLALAALLAEQADAQSRAVAAESRTRSSTTCGYRNGGEQARVARRDAKRAIATSPPGAQVRSDAVQQRGHGAALGGGGAQEDDDRTTALLGTMSEYVAAVIASRLLRWPIRHGSAESATGASTARGQDASPA